MKGWRVLAITVMAMLVVVIGGFWVQAAMLTDVGWHFDSDSLRDWVSAAGTPIAAIAAVVATLGFRLDARSRREDDRRRFDGEKRRQAELISAWRNSEQVDGGKCIAAIGLANASDGVVYRVQIRLTCGPKTQTPLEAFRLRELCAYGYLTELPPGKWKVRLELGSTNMSVETVDIFFNDQNQVRWGRDPEGMLIESPPQPFSLPPLQGPWPYEAASLTDWQQEQTDPSSPTYVPIQVLERAAL